MMLVFSAQTIVRHMKRSDSNRGAAITNDREGPTKIRTTLNRDYSE